MEKQQVVDKVATNLRNLMNDKGLSNADLAKKAAIPTGTISKILKGDMSITIPMLLKLAKGLEVSISDILDGIITKTPARTTGNLENEPKKFLSIGILSLGNKRLTCVKDQEGNVISHSELAKGLDLAETLPSVLSQIQESIHEALRDSEFEEINFKQVKLAIVLQSYEFESTRKKFETFASKHFSSVKLFPDWQITYWAAFKTSPGISVVIDKGVSCSYMFESKLHKLGGWKFPVYDLGGENWIGLEAIRHTIDAAEGYIPMTKLARSILAKFQGKIERITETCFKDPTGADVYCLFSNIVLRNYVGGEEQSKKIIEKGFHVIFRAVEKIDSITKTKLKITLNGALADIYQDFFPQDRLLPPSHEEQQVELLADLTNENNFEKTITI